MARLARVVIPGIPHHVTQRGNGRARVFFGDRDYAFYRVSMAVEIRTFLTAGKKLARNLPCSDFSPRSTSWWSERRAISPCQCRQPPQAVAIGQH